MSAADPEHIAFACLAQLLFDISDTVDRIGGNPIPATKDRLLPPWTRIASCLRAHPTGLALLIAEQTLQKKACVPRNTFLPEQRTYPLLNLPKRRRPQRKRLFNRRCLRPRSSNHGRPWIQNRSRKATVMLGQAFILVIVVVFLFLGNLRATIIPAVAVP